MLLRLILKPLILVVNTLNLMIHWLLVIITGIFLIMILMKRAACYQQLGNYEMVVSDATMVLEHDVWVTILV